MDAAAPFVSISAPVRPRFTAIAGATAVTAFTILLGAFQLFLVQPIMGRFLLPRFGGSASVWTTCLLVFQALLLAGYAYAYGLSRLPARRQAIVHAALLLASLGALPLRLPDAAASIAADPSLEIMTLLVASIGLPCVLLSSTSPLLQHWLSSASSHRSPYRLFALSNLGAIAGLLAYPFAIEPLVGLETQATTWSIGYAAFALSASGCAVRWLRTAPREAPVGPVTAAPSTSRTDAVLWLALATTSTTLFMSTTHAMSQDVAVVPLLWVLPLGIYLLTFAICFERDRWYSRRICGSGLVIAVAALGLGVLRSAPLPLAALGYLAALFACCMVCHGELARLKPRAGELTRFYLTIAAGGASGGVLVGVIAPRVFTRYWEFEAGLIAAYGLLALCSLRRLPAPAAQTRERRRPVRRGARAFAFGGRGLAWSAGLGAIVFLFSAPLWPGSTGEIATRTFYGIHRVRDNNVGTKAPVWARSLWSGRVLHGAQLLDPQLRQQPILYYTPDGGVGVTIDTMRRLAARPADPGLRIGVVGLGVGAMAAWGRAGDTIRFYEIDPDVERIARQHFSFLADTDAEVDVVIGDARLSLERELREQRSRQFDVLVLDAFSGDAVPVHLMTTEAFASYAAHLREGGVIAVHISNRHLDLRPIVAGAAHATGMNPLWLTTARSNATGALNSQWILATKNARVLSDYRIAEHSRPLPSALAHAIAPWTDDYSDLLHPLLLRSGWIE